MIIQSKKLWNIHSLTVKACNLKVTFSDMATQGLVSKAARDPNISVRRPALYFVIAVELDVSLIISGIANNTKYKSDWHSKGSDF